MPLRAVVDANVWVSAVINERGFPALVVDRWRAGDFVAIVCPHLLSEIIDVLGRPRVRRLHPLTDGEVRRYVRRVAEFAELAEPTGQLHVCRDPDDDLILEAAIVGGATHIVTRDDDLKGDPELVAAMAEHGIEILSVQRFLDLLDAPDQ